MKSKKLLPAHKLSLIFVILFSVACLKVCAEEKTLSPGEALVAREKFIEEAKRHIGSPYVFGGIGPEDFDCSGLIYFCAREALQYQLPRTARAIYNYVSIVPEDKREAGDLLFFKTTSSGTVSHVGIYIGNGQFISAISDGPNTGVIVSSLNQDYWKDKYMGTGQFLPSGNKSNKPKRSTAGTDDNSDDEVEEVPAFYHEDDEDFGKALSSPEATFADKLIFDEAVYFDWSLLSPRQFVFKYRGIDAVSHVRYAGWNLQPGAGFALRFNTSMGSFQLPVILSLTLNDYIRVYAGPVFTFSDVTLIDSDKEVKPSVFPGVIGAAFSTPAFNINKFKLQAVQDISYTIFNNMDGSALSFMESAAAGFVFYTGLRLSFPLSVFTN